MKGTPETRIINFLRHPYINVRAVEAEFNKRMGFSSSTDTLAKALNPKKSRNLKQPDIEVMEAIIKEFKVEVWLRFEE